MNSEYIFVATYFNEVCVFFHRPGAEFFFTHMYIMIFVANIAVSFGELMLYVRGYNICYAYKDIAYAIHTKI